MCLNSHALLRRLGYSLIPQSQFALNERVNDYAGCAHKWEVKPELPFGDPITGRNWSKPGPDIGTYQGGTFPTK